MKFSGLTVLFFLFSFTPAGFAQGRLNQPSFFQDGQVLMQQEINRLQQQQQQIQQTQDVEHPSQLLTIDTGVLRWQKSIFRSAGFSVWMPEGIQSQEIVTLTTPLGAIMFDVFATHPANSRFIAAYSEQSFPTTDNQSLLKTIRDGIINKTQFQLIQENAISVQGNQGIQFTLNGNNELITFQVMVINQKVYVLAAGQNNVESVSQDVTNFFNSFRLLP
ncbi:MAG: hypothetical protein VKL41_22590 [Snowella sp.]|nr:hypothetical protein [Snowella sp.]